MTRENKKKNHHKNGEQSAGLPPELKASNPFRVPEKYFEDLPASVMKKIHEQQPAAKKPDRSTFRYYYIGGIAAALSGMIIVFYFLLQSPSLNNNGAEVAGQVDLPADIMEYLAASDWLGEDDILEVLLENGVNSYAPLLSWQSPDSIPAIRQELPISDTSITDDDIIQYLLDEGFDPDEL
jgi:hypothetical protein